MNVVVRKARNYAVGAFASNPENPRLGMGALLSFNGPQTSQLGYPW